MARNKLNDLSDHLFEQIERLNDPSLKGDELSAEIQRAKAMAGLATPIVNAAKTTVDAIKLYSRGDIDKKMIGAIVKTTD